MTKLLKQGLEFEQAADKFVEMCEADDTLRRRSMLYPRYADDPILERAEESLYDLLHLRMQLRSKLRDVKNIADHVEQRMTRPGPMGLFQGVGAATDVIVGRIFERRAATHELLWLALVHGEWNGHEVFFNEED